MTEFITQWTKFLLYDAPDPRTRQLPLIANPLYITILICVWLFGVLRVGPRFMANRKPMQLKGVIQVINVLQILSNGYVVYELLNAALLNGHKIRCQECNLDMSKDSMRVVRANYVTFLLKIFDLTDTIIFLLRGNTRQVTFLHVYHHVATLILAWMGVKYAPTGAVILTPILNGSIHVAMYGYYFLAALGPQYQQYLWWKKYLTGAQMVQFVILITVYTDHIFHCKSDNQTPVLCYFVTILITFLYLFMQFYLKTYTSKKTKSN